MNTTDLPIRIVPSPTGDEPALTTFAEFIAVNADLWTPAELDTMRAELAAGRTVPLNLGAAGTFELMPNPCLFYIEDLGPYHGFAHGTTWNGFDDVSVTPDTLATINADLAKTEDDQITATIGTDGLVSLAGGYCACIQHSAVDTRS